MPILTSSFTTDPQPQADGSTWVYERHTDHTGKVHKASYLAPAGFDMNAAMTMRATNIGAAVDAQAAAAAEAANFSINLTKLEFRNLFTQGERMNIDGFNVSFETRTDLTAEQKAQIRTNLEDFKAAQDVSLTSPATIAGVQLYETLGLIAPGRAAEILGA